MAFDFLKLCHAGGFDFVVGISNEKVLNKSNVRKTFAKKPRNTLTALKLSPNFVGSKPDLMPFDMHFKYFTLFWSCAAYNHSIIMGKYTTAFSKRKYIY